MGMGVRISKSAECSGGSFELSVLCLTVPMSSFTVVY